MPDRTPARRERLILTVVFVCALLGHCWLATRNWTVGFMLGHEFRQAQTAFVTHFIDRNNDFSLLYEAPIVGKPWVSILLEVPVYEWSVVLLSRATGLPHVVAARSVSLACFYLALPAFYLLLGRLGLPGPRRLLPLTLIVLCPIHIFYSRSFLMESMELMCCAWFLVGYVWMMDRRRWPWFMLATVAGTGAALIKSVTFAVWLVPAAAHVAWLLWREVRARAGGSAPLQTAFWGLAGVTVPLGALHLWIELTDPLKAAHASAWIFTSKNLSQDNWGIANLAARFSADTWGVLLQRWQEALMPPGLIGLSLAASLLALPAQRLRIAGLTAVFFTAQLMFPFAYAYQEYYFYACAVFLLAGLGCALHGLFDTRLPRWLCWLLAAVLPAAQLHTYWRVYYAQQIIQSEGGFPFTWALRDFTPRESAIVVAGADWAAMVPLYAQRRALMVRNGLVHDRAYLERAFAELADEDVSALVLLHDQRQNTLLRDLAVAAFDLEPAPTFSHAIADIYCSRHYADRVRQGIKDKGYGWLTIAPPPGDSKVEGGIVKVNGGLVRNALAFVSPVPLRVRSEYGLSTFGYEGGTVFNAHPHADLWLRAPAGARRIEWAFGMISSAWEKAGDKTDGVELSVTGLVFGAAPRVLYRRVLDPVRQAADRGRQQAVIPFTPRPGELLHFSTGPGGSISYDWTYWARIEVK